MLDIDELAQEADCVHWTIRRYVKLGIVTGWKDKRGKWHFDPGEADKIRRRMRERGGPGGRPLIARS
jgi:hypothetical protein